MPNQTTIIFGLIVCVTLGSIGIGSIGTAPVPVWPLAVALFLLPLRDFLAYPERELAKVAPRMIRSDGQDEYTRLAECIENLAQQLNLRKAPRSVIAYEMADPQPRALGTFRHWYIVIDVAIRKPLLRDDTGPQTTRRS